MTKALPTVAVLGASGLIGEEIATRLQCDGFPVVPIARRFNAAQRNKFRESAVEVPIISTTTDELIGLLSDSNAEIFVNCIGVLQDSSRGSTDDVHHDFVARLIGALSRIDRDILFIHLTIPGEPEDDRTSFSRSKRAAEQVIKGSSVPYVMIRPGFVIAPAAYGGSALLRALAALPIELPSREKNTPFSITSVNDIVRTIDTVARRWRAGKHPRNFTWDVMSRDQDTLWDVIKAFRERLGMGGKVFPIPGIVMDMAARLGDFVSRLGWSPPIRSTALFEMRRGVSGVPGPWIEATDITPLSLQSALSDVRATVQEKWFARLYLLKPLVFGSLVVFWFASGLIALTVAFDAATSILTSHGFSSGIAKAITVVSSLCDIAVGLVIAFRKSCRAGLVTGIGVSLFYMASAAVITPDMWIEPLGALVKTIPAIILMLVGLAILEDR